MGYGAVKELKGDSECEVARGRGSGICQEELTSWKHLQGQMRT
jgi:hypothetical protein